MNRRGLVGGAALGGLGLAAAARPAPAIGTGTLELTMVQAWPSGVPGVGTGVARLVRNIEAMAGGRLRIRLLAAGEGAPPLGCLEAVRSGAADLGHDAPHYHHALHPAFSIFCAMPFGMTADEQAAWMRHGGGAELWDELNAQFGIIAFAAGQTGTQSFGWFRREISTLGELRGLRMRIPGLGGELLRRVGGVPVLMPASEIVGALRDGVIEAGQFVGPVNDLALGFHEVAKISYGPGIQEPGCMLQLMVNRRRWDALPADLQAIIRIAARDQHEDMKAECDLGSGHAMEVLRTQHGVRFLRLNNEILTGLGNAAGEMAAEMLNGPDPYLRRVMRSYLASRESTMRFLRLNEQAFLNARALALRWPTVS